MHQLRNHQVSEKQYAKTICFPKPLMGPLHSYVALIHLMFLKICFPLHCHLFLVVLDKVLM